jgi:hypothetical protein
MLPSTSNNAVSRPPDRRIRSIYRRCHGTFAPSTPLPPAFRLPSIYPSTSLGVGANRICPRHQPSNTSEWLHPIATWLIPFAAFSFSPLLVNRGRVLWADQSRGRAALTARVPKKWPSWINYVTRWFSNMSFNILDYGGFLETLQARSWRAFSELAEDWWLSGIVLHATGWRRELCSNGYPCRPDGV